MTLANSSKTILADLVSPVIVFALRKWSNSWRIDNRQMSRIDRLLADGEGVIIVLWHGKYLPLFALAEGRNALVFTSQSFRGEIIARICRRFGYKASLIPSVGHIARVRLIHDSLKSAKLCAMVVDGPLGPYHQPKSGAIKLAASLGYLIVPVSMACNPKRVMTKRWDKRELPHWAAKVSLAVGDPVRIPAKLLARDVDVWNTRLKLILEDLDRKAELEILS